MNEQNQKPHLERDHTGRAWIVCGNARFLAFKSERKVDAEVEAGHWVSNVSRSGLEPVIVKERPAHGNFGCFMGDEVLFCGIRWACDSYAERWNAVFPQEPSLVEYCEQIQGDAAALAEEQAEHNQRMLDGQGCDESCGICGDWEGICGWHAGAAANWPRRMAK